MPHGGRASGGGGIREHPRVDERQVITRDDFEFHAILGAIFGSQLPGMTAAVGILVLPPANRWFKASAVPHSPRLG